jgi:hypothetical protein
LWSYLRESGRKATVVASEEKERRVDVLDIKRTHLTDRNEMISCLVNRKRKLILALH